MLFKSFVASGLAATATAQSLIEALGSNSQLSSLAGLINAQPGLAQTLGGLSNFTVLAPSNNALQTLLNSTTGASLANNSAAITALLQYHILNGTYPASAVTNSSAFIPTLLTNTAYANVTGGQRVDVTRVNNNVTIFSGDLNNSTVTTANVNVTGGVVHIINKVLTIPKNVSSTLIDAGASSAYGALNRTNLLATVNGLQNATFFIPNNDAFKRIGSALANISTETLASVLQYHVVVANQPLYSTSLTDGASVPALAGGNLNVRINGTNVFVNNARVVVPNVLVAGGVAHIINEVLNPGNSSATAGTNGTVGFSGASSASDAPFTSGVPSATTTIAGAAATGGSSSSSKAGASMPMKTGAVGVAALFGAAGAVMFV